MAGFKPQSFRQQGVGLIEVLITLVIMSVGLMGVAKMQVLASKSNHEAMQRSIAVQLANEIISGIRTADSSNIASYGQTYLEYNSLTAPAKKCTNDSTDKCDTTAEKILNDLWQWKQLIAGVDEQTQAGTDSGGLMNAAGCITINNSHHVEVIISWDGMSNAANSSANECSPATVTNTRRELKIWTTI